MHAGLAEIGRISTSDREGVAVPAAPVAAIGPIHQTRKCPVAVAGSICQIALLFAVAVVMSQIVLLFAFAAVMSQIALLFAFAVVMS